MAHKITALLVMPAESRQELLGLLENCGVDLMVARSCKEAARLIETLPKLDVVLTSIGLSDGTWWNLRQAVKKVKPTVQVIVYVPRPDGGIVDLLERGADDVLVLPYERQHIRRILDAAASRTYMRSQAARA